MVTGGHFPGGKARPGRDADHSPHLVPRSRMSKSYIPLSPSASMVCSGTALVFTWVPTLVQLAHTVTRQSTIWTTGINSRLGHGSLLRSQRRTACRSRGLHGPGPGTADDVRVRARFK
jgi:hypothetical protein